MYTEAHKDWARKLLAALKESDEGAYISGDPTDIFIEDDGEELGGVTIDGQFNLLNVAKIMADQP